MQRYTNKITLVKNARGMWDLDPFKGCEYGIKSCKDGCWGICYAAKIARSKGFDFGKTIYRYFENDKQLKAIGKIISQTSILPDIQPPFVRLGVMCDPSFDWEHTLSIVDQIKPYNPNIVIITKHWTNFTDNQIKRLKGLYINTSICALDAEAQRIKRLYWYNKLKDYCFSILRVNTADFNNYNLKQIQDKLLKNNNIIDNILRIPMSNILVKNKTLNVKKYKFLKGYTYASKHDETIYFGDCKSCPDQCGISLFNQTICQDHHINKQ